MADGAGTAVMAKKFGNAMQSVRDQQPTSLTLKRKPTQGCAPGYVSGRANCMRIIGLDCDEGDENGTPCDRFRTGRRR